MAETAPQTNQEQDINPWSVAGAQNEKGEVVAIDYLALSKSVLPQHLLLAFIRPISRPVLTIIPGNGTRHSLMMPSSSALKG
jgi:hypothetical protein